MKSSSLLQKYITILESLQPTLIIFYLVPMFLISCYSEPNHPIHRGPTLAEWYNKCVNQSIEKARVDLNMGFRIIKFLIVSDTLKYTSLSVIGPIVIGLEDLKESVK